MLFSVASFLERRQHAFVERKFGSVFDLLLHYDRAFGQEEEKGNNDEDSGHNLQRRTNDILHMVVCEMLHVK